MPRSLTEWRDSEFHPKQHMLFVIHERAIASPTDSIRNARMYQLLREMTMRLDEITERMGLEEDRCFWKRGRKFLAEALKEQEAQERKEREEYYTSLEGQVCGWCKAPSSYSDHGDGWARCNTCGGN